ncbi:hypothetical protein BUALT_Bualt15G0006900 [Buddleja alternifolia]|uniref:FAD-binding domain-containing protein n=1 Tax=Buddleja alternifolia TaxID=168488 RepID=A0AAV6WBL7_9LAMI|nr:hypothetical protein BUALT_Bualt15G0006900 [Buddleja alternifolia]
MFHRLGIRSLVLEAGDTLKNEGFAFTTWTNAWRALDAIGIAQILREKHNKITGVVNTSAISGITISQVSFDAIDLPADHESRCLNRDILMETLENELPSGTIRYSSKVVLIEDSGFFKSIHLADGTLVKTKVLIGCDGVNSVVAKFLGFDKPLYEGRLAIRGFGYFKDGHGFEPKFLQFSGEGVKYGIVPCDDHGVYWFLSFSSAAKGKEIQNDPAKMKLYVLSKLGKVSEKVRAVLDNTDLNSIICTPLRFRNPLEFLWGNISKDNVCIAGDALHPMTPDIGQGGCSSLEDCVVLARVLGEALMGEEKQENDEENEYRRIKIGLEKYAKERRWRSFDLVTTSYVVGFVMQSDGVVMRFLKNKFLGKLLGGLGLKKSDFDCGKLTVS